MFIVTKDMNKVPDPSFCVIFTTKSLFQVGRMGTKLCPTQFCNFLNNSKFSNILISLLLISDSSDNFHVKIVKLDINFPFTFSYSNLN